MIAADGVRGIVLFDGDCGLCSGTVQFIRRRVREPGFQLLPLQSPAARELLARIAASGIDAPPDQSPASPSSFGQTVVFIEDGQVHVRSTAALRIARHLTGAWPLFYGLIIVPRPLRDWIYDVVARHRHRWFTSPSRPRSRDRVCRPRRRLRDSGSRSR